MSLVLGQVTVGTAATFITTVPPGPFALTLVAGTASSVAISTTNNGTMTTFSSGAVINANSFVQYAGFAESAGAALYGVTSAGTSTVSYHLSTDH
jgi:hypothetical protein